MVKRREDEAIPVKQNFSWGVDTPCGLRHHHDANKSIFTIENMKSRGKLTHANHGRGKGPIEMWWDLPAGHIQTLWKLERVSHAWPPDQYVIVNMKSNAALLHANHGQGRGPIECWSEFKDATWRTGHGRDQAAWKVVPRAGQPGVWFLENMKSRGKLTHANHGRGRGPIEMWWDLSPDNPQWHWRLTQFYAPKDEAAARGTCAVKIYSDRNVKCRFHANENTTQEIVPESVSGCAGNMDENTTHVLSGMHMAVNGYAQYRFSEAWPQSYVSRSTHQWTDFTPLRGDGDAHCPENWVATGIQQRESWRGNIMERFYRLRCSRMETLRQSEVHYSPWYVPSSTQPMDYVVPTNKFTAENVAQDLVIGLETRWKEHKYRAIRFKTARFSGHCLQA